MTDDFELCIARRSHCKLTDHQLAFVNNLSLLIVYVKVIIYYLVSHYMKLTSYLKSWKLCHFIV